MFFKALRGILLVISFIFAANVSAAAPYAALVMDARTGEVVHSRNADTQLHPASLTKMMTLYLVFNEIEAGRMHPDQLVTISRKAAAQPASKLYLKEGQKIALRYLIRAAAIKSANDAAYALAEAVSGSVPRFADYMNLTARAMGMRNTHFKNPHGLTQSGHLSTARDMATLGRRLFYDFPDYYHMFSRISMNVSMGTVYNTNRKFLRAYEGADGIKTGYTNAAGFNLVASAHKGGVRVIAAMFGGTSVAQRNSQVAKLLDMGFDRVPKNVATVRPAPITVRPPVSPGERGSGVVQTASLPIMRAPPASSAAAVQMARNIDNLVLEALEEEFDVQVQSAIDELIAEASEPHPLLPTRRPDNHGEGLVFASAAPVPAMPVAPVSVAPPREKGDWAIQVGAYSQETNTLKLLLQTALMDLDALDGAERASHVTKIKGVTMYQARFIGLSEIDARNACERLNDRARDCEVIPPSG